MGEDVTLTANLVLQKTRVDDLRHVKNLNLWGTDLTNVSIVRQMPNVEVLSLSVNRIRSLQDFASCPKLTELYLRKNEIGDLSEVQHLKGLKNLKVLWLCDNPCADSIDYRSYVIGTLPTLEKLDNVDISQQERTGGSQDAVVDTTPPETDPQPPPSGGRITAAADRPLSDRRGTRPTRQPVKKQDVMDRVRSKWQQPPENSPPLGSWPPQSGNNPMPATRVSTDTPPPQVGGGGVQEGRSKGSKPKGNKSASSQKNVMTAILALLNELNAESLDIIHQEISDRLAHD